jgi:hypothetical protein
MYFYGSNIGIGQTIPAFGFEVFSSSQTAITSNNTFGANLNFIFNRDNVGSTRNCFNILADQNAAYLRTLTSHSLIFNTNNTDRAVINTNGYFGIRTSDPKTALHVCGTNCGADISCGGGSVDSRGIIHAENNTSSGNRNSSVTVENACGIGQFMEWDNNGMRIGHRIIKGCTTGHVYLTTGQDAVSLTLFCGGISCFAGTVCVSDNIVITGPGMFINRPAASSGEPYIFWQKNGTTRGSIYGADNTAGLRYFADVNIFYGNVLPDGNNTRCLGTSTCAWAHIYTNDLHLSNEGKCGGNDIDGTNGNWTIQEGAENLYIINNKNNKKFKIQLQEII